MAEIFNPAGEFEGRHNPAWARRTDIRRGLTALNQTDVTGLPTGTAELNTLQWDVIAGAGDAVSDSSFTAVALTRDDDGTQLRDALLYAFDNSGSVFPPFGDSSGALMFSVSISSGTRKFAENVPFHNQINNVWPEAGPRPYMWIISPSHTDWIDGYSVRYGFTGGGTYTQDAMTVTRDFIIIDGVRFDAARVQLTGARSGSGDRGSAEIRYAEPPSTETTVIELVP